VKVIVTGADGFIGQKAEAIRELIESVLAQVYSAVKIVRI
jgi:nucleoside-diphosphate-sugar epimerase